MSDLAKRLRIKAGMIEMGEMIAWGSDSALMREAADALEAAATAVQGEKPRRYPIGPLTYEKVFDAAGLTNLSDMQAVLDAVEAALSAPAAPAVHGDPVGYINSDELDNMLDDRTATVHPIRTGFHATPLYTAPQPAEQQPDDSAAALLDKQCREDVAAALGFIRGGNYAWSYLLQQIKDAVSSEGQQPAPDVTQLVEALERCITSMLDSGYRADSVVMRAARYALAAYRKQGGEA